MNLFKALSLVIVALAASNSFAAATNYDCSATRSGEPILNKLESKDPLYDSLRTLQVRLVLDGNKSHLLLVSPSDLFVLYDAGSRYVYTSSGNPPPKTIISVSRSDKSQFIQSSVEGAALKQTKAFEFDKVPASQPRLDLAMFQQLKANVALSVIIDEKKMKTPPAEFDANVTLSASNYSGEYKTNVEGREVSVQLNKAGALNLQKQFSTSLSCRKNN